MRNIKRFQSAPLTEARGDTHTYTNAGQRRGFNPLPSPKQGETGVISIDVLSNRRFNPLPSPKQGETTHRRPTTDDCDVSIRSPHRSKGRHAPSCLCTTPSTFQSAPLTEARGDRRASRNKDHRLRFNPLPSPKQGETQQEPTQSLSGESFNPLPSPKQGETSPRLEVASGSVVSIRSPHRSKGRPGITITETTPGQFQSAPLTEARGDRRPRRRARAARCFNPLPSPKQGETASRVSPRSGTAVSIRSPHRSKGRRIVLTFKASIAKVSIRSPHRSKGRHCWTRSSSMAQWFQSAPLTEARGDA